MYRKNRCTDFTIYFKKFFKNGVPFPKNFQIKYWKVRVRTLLKKAIARLSTNVLVAFFPCGQKKMSGSDAGGTRMKVDYHQRVELQGGGACAATRTPQRAYSRKGGWPRMERNHKQREVWQWGEVPPEAVIRRRGMGGTPPSPFERSAAEWIRAPAFISTHIWERWHIIYFAATLYALLYLLVSVQCTHSAYEQLWYSENCVWDGFAAMLKTRRKWLCCGLF